MGVIGRPNMDEDPKVMGLIGDMNVGDFGYIFPEDLEFDRNYVPYLFIYGMVYPRETGGAKIHILRTGDGQSDFRVDIRGSNYIWINSLEPDEFEFEMERRGLIRLGYEDGRGRESNEDRLTENLEKAVREERYEDAAELRDRIDAIDESLKTDKRV